MTIAFDASLLGAAIDEVRHGRRGNLDPHRTINASDRALRGVSTAEVDRTSEWGRTDRPVLVTSNGRQGEHEYQRRGQERRPGADVPPHGRRTDSRPTSMLPSPEC